MPKSKTPKSPFTKEYVQGLLASNDLAVARAIVAIYRRQTQAEQANQATLQDNGVGFTGPDARFLSSLAQWVLKGYALTPRQLAKGRAKIMKYWKQLADVAEKKAALKAAQASQPAGA